MTHENFSMTLPDELALLARRVGLFFFQAMFQPETMQDIKVADDLVPWLESGIDRIEEDMPTFKAYEAEDGGSVVKLIGLAEQFLKACEDFPESYISVKCISEKRN